MKSKLVVAIPLILSAAVLGVSRSAAAADPRPSSIIVGTGTPESCTEFTLQDALTTARSYGGGNIKFWCGPNPVIILLTVQSALPPDYLVNLNLPNNTTIDGGGTITLTNGFNQGESAATVIFVDSAASVVLKNLTLSIGGLSYRRAIWNAGTLAIQGASVACFGSLTTCIYNEGNLRVQNSAVPGSRAFGGGGFLWTILNKGTVAIKDTAFFDNYGFGLMNLTEGIATIENSSFERQLLPEFGSGAAIANSGTLAVRRTQFLNNYTSFGGAIGNSGTLVLKDSIFSDNGATFLGGAISNGGQLTIENCGFFRNQTRYAGGAISNQGTLTVGNSDFSDNSAAYYGGALYSGKELTIRFSTLSGNTADYGGAIANGGQSFSAPSANGGQLRIGNSVINSNTAAQHGGGIYSYGTGTVQIGVSSQVTDNEPDNIFIFP